MGDRASGLTNRPLPLFFTHSRLSLSPAFSPRFLAWAAVSGGMTARYLGKPTPNHACCLISGSVALFKGSTLNMRGMRSLAPPDRWDGRV